MILILYPNLKKNYYMNIFAKKIFLAEVNIFTDYCANKKYFNWKQFKYILQYN